MNKLLPMGGIALVLAAVLFVAGRANAGLPQGCCTCACAFVEQTACKSVSSEQDCVASDICPDVEDPDVNCLKLFTSTPCAEIEDCPELSAVGAPVSSTLGLIALVAGLGVVATARLLRVRGRR